MVKILTSIGVSKIVALWIGPSGLALLGNLRDLIGVLQNVATLGLQKGIVRYTAEFKEKKDTLHSFMATVFLVITILSILSGIALWVYARELSTFLFKNTDYQYVIKCVSVTLPFLAVHTFFLSVLTGIGKYKRVLWANAISYVAYLLLVFLVVQQYGLAGALTGIAVYPVILLFITLSFCDVSLFIFLRGIRKRSDKEHLLNLRGYAVMRVLGASLMPLTVILIREHTINSSGGEEAGYLESVWRISDNYMLFVYSLIGVYVLPKLSEDVEGTHFKEIFVDFYKSLLPIFLVGIFSVYFLRDWILQLLYSSDFLPASPLIKWQLLGDLFRFLTLVMVAELTAKKMVSTYIITEFILASMFLGASYVLLARMGIEGIPLAYCISSILMFFVMLVLFKDRLLGRT